MTELLPIFVGVVIISVSLFVGWQIIKKRTNGKPDVRTVQSFRIVVVIVFVVFFVSMSDRIASLSDASEPTTTIPPINNYELTLNSTTEYTHETDTIVMLDYFGERGQEVSLQVDASDESTPVLSIINAPDGNPQILPQLPGIEPNYLCGYGFLDNGTHHFVFDAEPDVTYTVTFLSGDTCEE